MHAGVVYVSRPGPEKQKQHLTVPLVSHRSRPSQLLAVLKALAEQCWLLFFFTESVCTIKEIFVGLKSCCALQSKVCYRVWQLWTILGSLMHDEWLQWGFHNNTCVSCAVTSWEFLDGPPSSPSGAGVCGEHYCLIEVHFFVMCNVSSEGYILLFSHFFWGDLDRWPHVIRTLSFFFHGGITAGVWL